MKTMKVRILKPVKFGHTHCETIGQVVEVPEQFQAGIRRYEGDRIAIVSEKGDETKRENLGPVPDVAIVDGEATLLPNIPVIPAVGQLPKGR